MSVATEKRWIWPFELQEKIGEGGMGIVYRARYVKNNRLVAVKLLPDEVATNETVSARFKRELESLKTLRHPNIVHCFGGVCEDKQQFYAMELVDGGTLDGLLRQRGRFSWEQVIEYGLQICAALAYAHERGIIHRDVKPANFLIGSKGELKLSDFGIALAMTAPKLTSDGMTVGSYHYMAPEQIRGKPPVSPQTDLYAVGCVLFELLAGRPPFEGDTAAEIMHKHLKEPPPRVAAFAYDCPAPLDGLVAQLLEKDPDRRPANAAMVARSLRSVTQTVTVGVRSLDSDATAPQAVISDTDAAIPRKSGNWLTWILAGCVVLLSALWAKELVHERQNPQLVRAAELWVQAYGSKKPDVRIASARALGEIGSSAVGAVGVLTNGLDDKHSDVRQATAEALGKIGAEAKPAIASLLRLQNSDESPGVRTSAAAAVADIRNAESADRSGWGAYVVVGGLLLFIAGGGLVVKRVTREMPDG